MNIFNAFPKSNVVGSNPSGGCPLLYVKVNINFIRKNMLICMHNIPWAGVSMAPRGEIGTLLSQERDVMEENITS